MTGLIYAAIVAAWAAYLVPLWLRRHDEESATRSVDRFSTAMQALADAGGRDTGDTTAQSESSDTHDEAADDLQPDDARPEVAPAVGITAATRRRRTLIALLGALTVTLAFAVLGVVSWWLVGGTVLLVGGFLGLSVTVAAKERRPVRSRRPVARTTVGADERRTAEPTVRPEQAADPADTQDTAEQPAVVAELGEEYRQAPVEGESGERWDPVEVPLPTYVTKPKAPSAARRIDQSATPSPGGMLLDESGREPTGIRDELYDREIEAHRDFDDRRAVGET